jgi:hypothetical protein
MSRRRALYGFLAEFDTPANLLDAARRAYASGYRRLDAFSPLPIEGLAEAIGFTRSRVPALTLMGGIIGGLIGFGVQYYSSVVSYPLNVGGRPLNSWPSFVPITFELTILGAALVCVFGMFALNGLPTPYHPVFNVPRFALASRDRFFLCVKARDPRFDPVETRKFLEALNSRGVFPVET